MLCAYNSSEHGRRYVSDRVEFSRVTLTGTLQLEGHELSYLRAIGVFRELQMGFYAIYI
jgi:hypothetical protein